MDGLAGGVNEVPITFQSLTFGQCSLRLSSGVSALANTLLFSMREFVCLLAGLDHGKVNSE